MLPALSATRLSLFLECPRCFWLAHRAGIARPKTPFPSLPNGIDLALKRHYDRHRKAGSLPPELDGLSPGRLFDNVPLLTAWRDWRRGIRVRPSWARTELVGALDDCLIDPEGRLCPLDYKTRGWAPKVDTSRYYQHQLDLYALLLREAGYPTGAEGVLIYYYPRDAADRGAIAFDSAVHRVRTDPDAARTIVEQAVATLTGPLPDASSACGFCGWTRQLAHAIPYYTTTA